MIDNFESEVLQRLTNIETRLSNGITERQNDHESRIRELETFRWKLVGALAIIQIVGIFIARIIFK